MDEGRPPDPELPAESREDPAALGVEPAQTEEVALAPRGPSRALVAIALVVVFAMVVFAVLGGRIIAAPAPVPTAAVEARLAVTDGDGRLFTMDRDGGSVTELAIEGLQFGFPAWSPDGTKIAVTGNGADGTRLYLFDAAADTADPMILYDQRDRPPFYLYWSPGSRQIAFLTTEPTSIALRLVPADGSAEATVVREGSPLYWDWFGNDHLVAHIGLGGDDAFLGELDLAGDSTEAEPLEPGFFRSPAVSRDGSFRAYVASGEDSTGVVTLESADKSSRQVAPVFGVAAVSFDPTGSTLAYVASEDRSADDLAFPLGPLKSLDPATGASRTLLASDVVAFFWSPDGKTIAALTLAPDGDEIVGVPGAGLVAARDAGPGTGPGVEPPSNQGVPLLLVFVDVDSGTVVSNRTVKVTSRYVNNILPYYDQYALSHRHWAPDSSAVVMPLDANGKDRLFVIPADGSDMTQLGDAELGFWSRG
jgi:TolB protein